MNNLETVDLIISEFKNFDKKISIIFKEKEFTYSELFEKIEAYKKGFSYLESHQIVGLEGDFNIHTIALLFALISKKIIVVPFDYHLHEKNSEKYSIANLDILLEVDENGQINKQEFKTDRNELYNNLPTENSGLVLFTSGSSGKPKAALHNFDKLLKKFLIKRTPLRTINFLLFDHWGGLNTLFHILSNGGTVFILENRSPEHVCEIIEKYKVELLPASPTFLNLLIMSRAYQKYSLNSLQLISYGAEPMPESVLNRMTELFPAIKLQQTYGLIELGVLRNQSEGNNSLWVKIGGEGYDIRVVDDMLQIKSDSAMIGYLNAPSPFTEDGYFITGDKVEVKGEYFKILGRNSELINVGGEKVFPQEVENVIQEIEIVEDALVYGEDNKITGKIVCADVQISSEIDAVELTKLIKTYCRTKLAAYKIPIKIRQVENIKKSDRYKKLRI